MEKNQEPLQQLIDIRNIMERSSRFISLSGLSGVSAGIIAIIGAALAFFYLDSEQEIFNSGTYFSEQNYLNFNEVRLFIISDALAVLILAVSCAIYFTTRRARKKGLKVWDKTGRRLVINLMIPLVAGGIFCMILFYHRIVFLIAPATLLFYGLALINAAKYTFQEIKVLGISEVILGLIASMLPGYGLIFWAIGFGLMHIFYGLMMYYRYEAIPTDAD